MTGWRHRLGHEERAGLARDQELPDRPLKYHGEHRPETDGKVGRSFTDAGGEVTGRGNGPS